MIERKIENIYHHQYSYTDGYIQGIIDNLRFRLATRRMAICICQQSVSRGLLHPSMYAVADKRHTKKIEKIKEKLFNLENLKILID